MSKKELERELAAAAAERVEDAYKNGVKDGMKISVNMLKPIIGGLIKKKALSNK